MIDLYASLPHYLDHLLDATEGLPVHVIVPTPEMHAHAARRGVTATRGNVTAPGGPTLVGGYVDARAVHRARPLGLVEHGAGQTYLDVEHQGYAGGPGWSRLDLVLSPGPHAADRWRAAYPHVTVCEIGAPRHAAHTAQQQPVVACTWHWPCGKSVESGTAWDAWHDAVGALEVPLLGTWHPRWSVARRRNQVRDWWAALGVAHTADPEAVFACADVLVCDNTSLAYEFAATGRPVVSLNAPHWRRDVEHGLRFWSHVPGLCLDAGDDLAAAIDAALCGAGEPERQAAVAHVYRGTTLDGRRLLDAWVRSHEGAAQYAPPG